MKALRGGNLRVLSAKRIGAAPHFGYHLEHRGYHSAIMFCMHLPTFAALCPHTFASGGGRLGPTAIRRRRSAPRAPQGSAHGTQGCTDAI